MMNKKMVKKIAGTEVKAHEKRMHKAKKMKAGGPTTDDMKSMGRNMARAMNQGSN